MNEVRYANRAKEDLLEIGRYSLGNWGIERARRYLEELEDCCDLIARSPGLGRLWRFKGRDFRRMEHGSHMIFYREKEYGILVCRILHQRMIPSKHAFDES